jgi:CheY-like chemotaxis protein
MVMTDVLGPVMDGPMQVRGMVLDEQMRRLQIIIVSGGAGPKKNDDGPVQGAAAFLPAPVKSRELREYTGRYPESGRKSF